MMKMPWMKKRMKITRDDGEYDEEEGAEDIVEVEDDDALKMGQKRERERKEQRL